MINGSNENIEKRLIAYRDILKGNAQAYQNLSQVTREGEQPIERARSQAYQEALKKFEGIFPEIKKR